MSDTRTWYFAGGDRVPEDISIAVRDAVAKAVGKPLRLTLGPDEKYASVPQLRYYRGVIVERWCSLWFRHTGERLTNDEMHEWLMRNIGKFFKEIIDLEGNPFYLRISYMDLTTPKVEDYHMKCRAEAAKWGENIPEPNEPEYYTTERENHEQSTNAQETGVRKIEATEEDHRNSAGGSEKGRADSAGDYADR